VEHRQLQGAVILMPMAIFSVLRRLQVTNYFLFKDEWPQRLLQPFLLL
jgi:hypothetical protein